MIPEGARRWKELVIKMPDSLFYNLARIYLGEIQTPFTKQQIRDRLYKLFSNKEIQEEMLRLIGEKEAQILTAIYYIPNPTAKKLYLYFQDTHSYLEIHHLVINLEERFLVFSDKKGNLELSPLFQEILLNRIVSLSCLSDGESCRPQFDQAPPLNDFLVLGFLSLIVGQKPFKKDGNLKSKELNEYQSILGITEDQLILLHSTVIRLDLFESTEHGVELMEQKLEALGKLSPSQRFLLYLSASDSGQPEKRAGNIHQFLQWLPPDRIFHSWDLQKIYSLLDTQDSIEEILHSLATWGILIQRGEGKYTKNGSFSFPAEMDFHEPAVVETNFDLRIPPTLSFEKQLKVLQIARLKKLDVMPLYTVSKEATLSTLGQGKDPKEIMEILPSLAAPHPLAPLVQQSMTDWVRDFHSLQVHHGYILKAEPNRIEFLKNLPVVKENILEELAPGIFLMRSETQSQWREALAQINHNVPPPIQGEPSEPEIHRKIEYDLKLIHPPDGIWKPLEEQEISTQWIPQIEKGSFSREQRDELVSRVNRKIILWEGQLNSKSLRFEKKEASGLDFSGKVRIIEQVIKSEREILEIKLRGSSEAGILFSPATVKRNHQDYLVTGILLPGEEEESFMVSKMAIVKKVPSSLFLY